MIDGTIYVEDLVKEHPEVVAPLTDMGIVCIACGEPVWGTLENLIEDKGISDPEPIYKKINNIIKINGDK